jgi:protein-tyrosine phosphatase
MANYVRLPLANAYNARDLGGYACDGGITKFRAFVRSDGLEALDDGDIQFLKDYGIRTIIDLRSADELKRAPTPQELFKFAEYFNIPLIVGDVGDATKVTEEMQTNFLAEFYLQRFKNCQEILREVIDAIAKAKEGGILFHCAAGKDRTGIVAALLLLTVGVCPADVVSNYETTYTHIKQNPRIMAHKHLVPEEYLFSNPSYLEPSLEYLDDCGGALKYLAKIGVTDSAVEKIRARFVAPA